MELRTDERNPVEFWIMLRAAVLAVALLIPGSTIGAEEYAGKDRRERATLLGLPEEISIPAAFPETDKQKAKKLYAQGLKAGPEEAV